MVKNDTQTMSTQTLKEFESGKSNPKISKVTKKLAQEIKQDNPYFYEVVENALDDQNNSVLMLFDDARIKQLELALAQGDWDNEVINDLEFPHIALAALYKSKISWRDFLVLMMYSNAIRDFGKENVSILHLLDSKNNISASIKKQIEYAFDFYDINFPKKYPPHLQREFLNTIYERINNFKTRLLEEVPAIKQIGVMVNVDKFYKTRYANMFYQINATGLIKIDSEDGKNYFFFHPLVDEMIDRMIYPEITAIAMPKFGLFSTDKIIQYRNLKNLPHLRDIFKAKGIRLVDLRFPGVRSLMEAHYAPVSATEALMHDYYHKKASNSVTMDVAPFLSKRFPIIIDNMPTKDEGIKELAYEFSDYNIHLCYVLDNFKKPYNWKLPIDEWTKINGVTTKHSKLADLIEAYVAARGKRHKTAIFMYYIAYDIAVNGNLWEFSADEKVDIEKLWAHKPQKKFCGIPYFYLLVNEIKKINQKFGKKKSDLMIQLIILKSFIGYLRELIEKKLLAEKPIASLFKKYFINFLDEADCLLGNDLKKYLQEVFKNRKFSSLKELDMLLDKAQQILSKSLH